MQASIKRFNYSSTCSFNWVNDSRFTDDPSAKLIVPGVSSGVVPTTKVLLVLELSDKVSFNGVFMPRHDGGLRQP